MAQLKVKQISDFVAAVGTIHNGVVGTGTATAIGTAKSEAISAASSDATSKANAAQSAAESTASADATSKANTAKSEAIAAAALDATSKANGALSDAKSYSDIQKGRIDALLLDSTEALDTFTEIENFIKGLDTADIVGLVNDISTAKTEAIAAANGYTDGREVIINKAFADADKVVDTAAQGYASDAESNANGYTDGREIIINKAFADADIVVDSAAQGYASDAESNAVATASADATSKANAALASAKSYADTAESDAIASANGYTDTEIAALDLDLQGQIDLLSGVNSDEVIATFVDKLSFDARKVFNLNGGHVAVFVNGLQIHEAGEGVDGWRSANGQLFTVEGLGYELEADDHIVVSGTLA